MRLSNVRLLTGDFDASYHFWRDVMGLTWHLGRTRPEESPITPTSPSARLASS
jgi:catechol 2,3-dioxygenase-like lactoylglutathione lyase family enzyme